MASHKEMLKARPLNRSEEKLFQIHPGFFSHENSCVGNGKRFHIKRETLETRCTKHKKGVSTR